MKDRLTVAKVLRPRGLKGVVKIEAYSDDPSRWRAFRTLGIGGAFYEVEDVSPEGGFAYVKLRGVDDADAAEKLRGAAVTALRSELPPPPAGRYYIADLLGAEVYAGGEDIGELVDVLQYGSADVYVVRTEDGTVSFPALAETVREVDAEGGRIVLDDAMFARTAVYNK